jgi:hypothetical protein
MPEHSPSDHGRAVYPQHNEKGGAITQHASVVPPSHHAAVERNPAFVRGLQSRERAEVVPNHYYWHNENGLRYSHYYDGHNHWYGFYHGPTFYWTRYYGNRWWWFDGPHTRWVFWWNGFWWWPGVNGVPYVYVDNNYYPYQDSGVTVEQAQPQPAPPATIPAPGAGKPVVSPDGRRMVQMGSDGQAFLYDKTKTPPTFMKYLGQGVTNVRFWAGPRGLRCRFWWNTKTARSPCSTGTAARRAPPSSRRRPRRRRRRRTRTRSRRRRRPPRDSNPVFLTR